MAFKPTPQLLARGDARLKGYRAPAIKTLRQAIVNTNELELPGILKQNFTASRFDTSSAVTKSPTSAPGSGIASIPKEELLALQRAKYGWNSLRPSKRKHALDWTPPPYGQRHSVQWKHVVYSYNKNKTQAMPLLTSRIRKTAQAYLNMEPRPAGFEEEFKGKNPNMPKFGIDARQKAFVSGYNLLDQPVMPDLLGKLSEQQKSFMIPYRELLGMEPPVIFKHRANSCKVSLHVYDERLEDQSNQPWKGAKGAKA